jgi:hypothetical protein
MRASAVPTRSIMMKLQADTVSISKAKAKGSSAIGPEALAFMKTNVCHDARVREVTSMSTVNILHVFGRLI